MNSPILPLQVANDIEPERSWEGIKTPHDLIKLAARMLGVDSAQLNRFDEILISPLEPTGDDRNKLWIKSEGAPGLGIPIGGTYQVLYNYPPNIPLLWFSQTPPPSYLSRMVDSELEAAGLENPEDTNFYYVILKV